MPKLFKKVNMTSFRIIIFGFMAVILTGALLLCLPFSTLDGKGATFADALFTSTSAVCVTGLIVQDTATYWSVFGQFVILLLIQIGGLGVVTVAISVALVSGRKIGLMQRSTMQEAVSAPKVGGIVKLTRFILQGVFIIEFLGAVSLSFVFIPEFGFLKGVWYSVFHSISAFCNAGFDLMGVKEQFSSIVSYRANPIVNMTIMLLIAIGGIGFLTWEDVIKNKWHFHRYRMQSKTILVTTACLILFPALYFFFFEFKDLPMAHRIWASIFQSVTPRTAGFNSTDLTKVSEVGIMLFISLMVIGGSPGSTAGGMKTTTFAVLLSSAVSVFLHRENAEMFKRRISDSVIKYAASILLMYVTLFVGGGMIISYTEGLPLMTTLFETASAIGTVGLSLGITPGLSMLSRGILIALMFFGRVGGLTLVFAAVSTKKVKVSKFPQENITVG